MRLDKYLAEKYSSRTKAVEAIEKGLVFLNGKMPKPSDEYNDGDKLTFIEPDEFFVSNGGYKLSRAIKEFSLNFNDMTFVDIGASNGGFTHCLLKNGAKRVFAVDVGESLLEPEIANDSRVVVMDNCNARYLSNSSFSEQIEGIVVDVSFISLKLIFPAVADILNDGGIALALIKPQFECGKKHLNKHGIVTDRTIHKNVIEEIIDFAEQIGLKAVNLTSAPIKEKKNVEFVIQLIKSDKISTEKLKLINCIDNLYK